MKMNIGRKITTWVRKVVVLVLAYLIIYQPAFAAHIPITIEEEDGTPSLANIKTIQVAPNKLTSLGNGALLLNVNGDITAAANFTDNRLIKADGTAGLESSGITISDTDNISGVVDFTSTGNASIGGTLGVTGATTLSSTLAVTGAATFSSTADVTGNATVGGTLGVTGATTLSSTLGVTGAATFSSTTNTTGNATMNANVLIADGQAAPSADANFGKIYVNGDNLYYLPANVAAEPFLLNNGGAAVPGADNQVVFNSNGALAAEAAFTYDNDTDTLVAVNIDATDIDISAAATVGSTLDVTGNTTIGGTLGVTGATTLSDTLAVTGAATFSSTADITGNATVGGTLGVTGATTLSSTLGVTGAATFSSTADVTGNATVGGTLGVTGATTLSSTLAVTGAATFSSTADVTGNATVGGTLGVTGATTLSSTLGVTGATTLSDTLAVTGAATFSSTTNTTGNATMNANVLIADGQAAPSADANFGKIYVNGDNLYYLPANVAAEPFLLNNGGAAVPGVDTQVVFNDGGALGADAGFTYIKGTDTLQVDGTINGSAVTADALTITGASTFTGNVGITGDVNHTGNINTTGNITASATVTGLLVQGTTVNGDTVTGDALTITGASTFTGNVGITGNTTQTGDIDLTGNSTFTGTFDITGATTITGATSITGTLTASDDFTVDTSTLFVDASANQVGIGTTSTVELLTVNGITAMAESSAPSATAGYGKLYVKTDSQLYYMDGSGVEQALSTSATAISTKTANYTIVSSDYSILGNAASESITISLPAAASYTGRMFVIKKIDSSANLVTIDPNGAETIDGASTYDLNVQWEAIQVQSNGTSWFVL